MNKFILCFSALLSLNAQAADKKASFGEVLVLRGKASTSGRALAVSDKVFVDDTVTTEKNSFASIKLADGSGAFQVGPASSVTLSLSDRTVTTIDLLKGFVLSTLKASDKPAEGLRYKVRTKTVAMGVRGTTFFARADKPNKTFQCICEGRVEAVWKKGEQTWESKHHENRHFFDGEKAVRASLDLPTNHTDEEIAELKKLLD